MDPQQLLAEPEQRDEDATEWTHRPSNLPLLAVTQTVVPQTLSLLEGPETLGDFPMGIDLQRASQPTSLVTFQPYQQSAGFAGHTQVHEPDLPEDVRRELAEAEFRHTAACWEILERAHAFSANFHQQEIAASYADVITDETVTGHSGVYDPPNVPVDPRQILNHDHMPNDSSSVYGFDLDVWFREQIPQTTFYPNTFADHVQGFRQLDNTFPNAQDHDPNASDHATYGQQSAIDPMSLKTSHYNTMAPVLSTYDQENHASFFEAPTQPRYTQSLLPLQGVRSVPVNASELPTYTTIDSVYDTTAPSAGLSWNGDINPSADHSLSMIMPELPSFPANDQSATTYLDVPGTTVSPVPSQALTAAAKPSERQIRLVKRKSCISDSGGDNRAESDCALDNIYFHTNSEADRQRQRAQPKRRKVTEKASWSCFGCRLSKRRCESSTDGLCLRCKDILNKYSYHTAVPKFTCDVRTKFAEISIFTNISPTKLSKTEILTNLLSSLPRPLTIDWDDGFIPITIGGPTKPDPRAVTRVAYRLLRRVRNFLDIIEPLHIRQLWSLESFPMIFWSYSFSMIRWKRAIRFHWPDLEEALDFHEKLHRSLHLVFLVQLDRMIAHGNHFQTAFSLNVWYEGISAMEITPIVDISVKGYLQSSLTHHLLHVYRSVFPSILVVQKSRRTDLDDWAMTFSMFPHTNGMLPPGYGFSPLSFIGRTWLRAHKSLSFSERKILYLKRAFPWDSPEQSERPFPATSAYVPARFRAVFGLDTETRDPDTSSQLMKPLEALIQEWLVEFDEPCQEAILDMSPYTLSIGTKVVFDRLPTRKSDSGVEREILRSIVLYSIICCEILAVVQHLSNKQKPVTLAEFVMDNRYLDDHIVQLLANASESSMTNMRSALAKKYPKVCWEQLGNVFGNASTYITGLKL